MQAHVYVLGYRQGNECYVFMYMGMLQCGNMYVCFCVEYVQAVKTNFLQDNKDYINTGTSSGHCGHILYASESCGLIHL